MYSVGIVQWNSTRRDHPGNPGGVSESGPVNFLVTTEFGVKAKRVYVTTELPEIVLQQGIPYVAIESFRT